MSKSTARWRPTPSTWRRSPQPLPSPQQPAPVTALVTVKAEVDILNVRSQPDTAYKIITTMKSGQQAEVLGKNAAGDWWQVKVEGTVGWVFAEMVDFNGDPAAVPVVASVKSAI